MYHVYINPRPNLIGRSQCMPVSDSQFSNCMRLKMLQADKLLNFLSSPGAIQTLSYIVDKIKITTTI